MSEVFDLDPSWRLRAAIHALDAMHSWRGWHWNHETDPFESAVGSILVQNTAWTNAERAVERLRAEGALEPSAMAALSPADLEDLVRPAGQYRQKARKLRAFLDLIDEAGSFEALLALPPPDLRERLLATWGIGEETADCIVLYAARQPSFVIDAYTRRIFGRIGLGPDPEAPYREWQAYFERNLPRDHDLWATLHALIVLHGKHLCRKRAPKCRRCVLQAFCPASQAFLADVPPARDQSPE